MMPMITDIIIQSGKQNIHIISKLPLFLNHPTFVIVQLVIRRRRMRGWVKTSERVRAKTES